MPDRGHGVLVVLLLVAAGSLQWTRGKLAEALATPRVEVQTVTKTVQGPSRVVTRTVQGPPVIVTKTVEIPCPGGAAFVPWTFEASVPTHEVERTEETGALTTETSEDRDETPSEPPAPRRLLTLGYGLGGRFTLGAGVNLSTRWDLLAVAQLGNGPFTPAVQVIHRF